MRTTPPRNYALFAKTKDAKSICMPALTSQETRAKFGLVDGPLSDVNEIDEVLERARFAWVQSLRAVGKTRSAGLLRRSRERARFRSRGI